MANPGRKDYQFLNTDDDPIPDGEPIFIIRAQDTLGYLVVMFYALLCEIILFNSALAEKVREHAALFKSWPTQKNPDLPRR